VGRNKIRLMRMLWHMSWSKPKYQNALNFQAYTLAKTLRSQSIRISTG